ncbi:MAG: acyl-CoA dehydratase activase-related protein [Clostridia bacterium]|nr:acyl-CoA dehydratase activase-related protein [Clostridia bacterium]
MKIGIPNAMLSHKYMVLWESFFKSLDFDVVISSKTNKEILENGIKYSNDESCLASKIFLGHVQDLHGKCDYIFIPRHCSFKNNDVACVKFNALYDICNNTFNNLKIVTCDFDYNRGKKEISEYLNIGKSLGRSYFKTFRAYIKAKNEYRKYCNNKYENQNEILKNKNKKDNNILIVSHPYITHDEILGRPIVNYLEKMGANIIYADIIPEKVKGDLWSNISKNIYWKYSKELLTGIELYKEYIDGIVFISVFSCGPDSLVTDLCIRKIKNIPCLNLVLDELNSDTGMQTRLESFVDVITYKKKAGAINE